MAEYENFIESYKKLAGAKTLSSNEYRNSDDPNKRSVSVNFAMDYAGSTPGLEDIVNEEDRSDSSKLDEYFGVAIHQYTTSKNGLFEKYRKEIVDGAPDSGLAKIVYQLPPTEIAGNDGHNEIVDAHKTYNELGELIEGVREEKIPYQVLLKEVLDYEKVSIDKGFEDDEILKDADEVKNRLYSIVARTLANPQRGISIANKIRGNARTELDEKLSDDTIKASYARENLMAIDDIEAATDAVFLAEQNK